MKSAAIIALLVGVQAKHHHHHKHHKKNTVLSDTKDMETLNNMSTEKLVEGLQTTLNIALAAEARDDKASAVAKTAAIKNIQKALTARILKRLDDGQPLVEVARKMKAIEGMQPQINDMERRLGIMQSVEPVLENAIKTLQKVVDVRGMGKALVQLSDDPPTSIGFNNNKIDCKAIEKNSDSKELATREDLDWCVGKHHDNNTKIDTDGDRAIIKAEGEEAGKEGADALRKADALEDKANAIANENKGAANRAQDSKDAKKANDKKFSKPKEEEKKKDEPTKEEKAPETPPEPEKEEEEVQLHKHKPKHHKKKHHKKAKKHDSDGDTDSDDEE